MEELVFSPSDFVAITNQTLEFAYGGIARIEGELAYFRVSKNKWVYFDIKDEFAKVSCFGSVYMLPSPLEDGMMVKITGQPRLHPQFGFSVTVQSIQSSGEGSIKKAFDLLKTKLTAEGLFDDARKRRLPYPPQRIALVTSVESAAYADFMKILSARWPFVKIDMYDVQVQGEPAPEQLAAAISDASQQGNPADIVVVTRGGGSADDLAAFNDERVVRAIAASRIPTLVAIGHEIDESLSELAADMRASTPSNAAELIAPDRLTELASIRQSGKRLQAAAIHLVANEVQAIHHQQSLIAARLLHAVDRAAQDIHAIKSLVAAYNPKTILGRGYALIHKNGSLVRSATAVAVGDILDIQVQDGVVNAQVTGTRKANKEDMYA